MLVFHYSLLAPKRQNLIIKMENEYWKIIVLPLLILLCLILFKNGITTEISRRSFLNNWDEGNGGLYDYGEASFEAIEVTNLPRSIIYGLLSSLGIALIFLYPKLFKRLK
jgi:hypothetical protein